MQLQALQNPNLLQLYINVKKKKNKIRIELHHTIAEMRFPINIYTRSGGTLQFIRCPKKINILYSVIFNPREEYSTYCRAVGTYLRHSVVIQSNCFFFLIAVKKIIIQRPTCVDIKLSTAVLLQYTTYIARVFRIETDRKKKNLKKINKYLQTTHYYGGQINITLSLGMFYFNMCRI